jgi:hypothetical protein
MNVVGSKPSSRLGRPSLDGSVKSIASSVCFYDDIPNFELSLDEFEEFALARLKVILYENNLNTEC